MRSILRSTRIAWLPSLALALALAACGPSSDARRIEGRWVSETFRFQGLGLPVGPDLSISRDSISLSGNAAAAGLDAMKLRGIVAEGSEVTLQTQIGVDIVFDFENDDRMYFSVPFTQSRIYYRRVPAGERIDVRPATGTPVAVAPATSAVASPASVAPARPTAAASRTPISETHYAQAVDALRRGDDDIALRSLSTALESGFSDWQRIDGQPLFDRLHGDMRFQVLRSRWQKG